MRRLAFLIFLGLALAGCSDSAPAKESALGVSATDETGIIRGVVVDEAIAPLAGVFVRVIGGDWNATTDTDGLFVFGDLSPGSYQVQAQRPGYFAARATVDVAAAVDEPPVTKLVMEADPEGLPYVQGEQFSGFMGYGITVAGARGSGGGMSGEGETGTELTFTRLPDWFQSELVWESTQDFGDGMELTFIVYPPGEATGSDFARAVGTSPVALGVSGDTLREVGVGGEVPLDITTFSAPSDTVPLGLTVEQRFDIFSHRFFGFTPPDGWSFVNDGVPRP